MNSRKLWELINHTSQALEGLITLFKFMWQVAYSMSLFSPRGARRDNYDWTVHLKYLSHLIGLTLNQLTRTSPRSLPVKNQLNHEALEKLMCHECSTGLSDKARQGGITLASPNQSGCIDLSRCYLRKRYITWGPDSPGHAWMYGADSGAGCHPSGLINEELGPVFNVFNMGRWRGRHTDGTHLSPWLMKSPAALALSFTDTVKYIHTMKTFHCIISAVFTNMQAAFKGTVRQKIKSTLTCSSGWESLEAPR